MVAGAGRRRVEGGNGSDIVRAQRPAHSARHAFAVSSVKAFFAMRSSRAQQPTLALRIAWLARCRSGERPL